MPMTQEDIRAHYRAHWKTVSEEAKDESGLRYSSEVEDAVVYPIYRALVREVRIQIDGGRVLDVGCGAGRWVRFFAETFRPASILGVDVAQASIDLLTKWRPTSRGTELEFRCEDVTRPDLDLGRTFDLINVANVLFHIPEQELFENCLRNLARHLVPGGRIVTTEYLPRTTMRTQWMLVRSRYEFESAAAAAGLGVCAVRAFSFFSNDPMGLDGFDAGLRGRFHKVRQGIQSVMNSKLDPSTRSFFVGLFADVERATIEYCRERVAELDLPSQKLVALGRSDEA